MKKIVVGVCLVFGIFFTYLKFSPLLQERLLWLGLLPGSPRPLQHVALFQLRNYPTSATAMAIVIYTNLKHSFPLTSGQISALANEKCTSAPSEEAKKTCVSDEIARLEEEENAKAPQRKKDNALAEVAVTTLCLLSGEAFGSYFEKNQWGGHTWGSLSDERWSTVLGQMNFWAARHFGMDALAAAGFAPLIQKAIAVVETMPMTAATPGITTNSQSTPEPGHIPGGVSP